ncbi:signal transduction histidine kinase [Kribbella aluminosa]|uniref:histidine kinase n=1 Tax=Kribbella aluminosa TaxID=416017 RepID=A0ABS4UV80_9ACTN|nr:sensor histidine kinase [Kribbella aluminosa]MBP2355555.1 signal transduction histidine kinase [Kribbella aluminosa]
MSAADASPTTIGYDDSQHLLELCHDLRQYVAAGLFLSDPAAAELVGPGGLALIHQQFRAIAELLDFEQTPARRIGGVNLTQLAGECADLVRLTYRVPVIFERAPRVMVAGEQALLRRAVGNLLDNACRAAGSGGQVQLRVDSADGEASVEVSDDGPGFGEIAAGTGHGLQVVAAAARAFGGRIEIVSLPGSGTTVRLCLPAGKPAVRSA